MGLVAEKGVLTAPASTGQQTYNLGSAFNGILPKALILWTSQQTTVDTSSADAATAIGFGTYRGSAVQQWFTSLRSQDNSADSDVSVGHNTSGILRGYTDGAATVDYEVDLVSLNSGTPSTFVLDWVDVPASQIKVHYLVLGGTDISDARAGSWTVSASSPESVTVASGFGQPDLLLFLSAMPRRGITDGVAGDGGFMLAAARSDTSRRCTAFGTRDAATNSTIGSWQKARAGLWLTAAQAADMEMDLDAKANWPTDGFQVVKPDLPGGGAGAMGYLALKGTFQSALGANVALTTGSTQDNDAGFPPVAALVWGNNLAQQDAINSTDGELGAFMLGSTDGTNEGCTAHSDDDNAATMDANRRFTESKTIQFYNQALTLQSEADGSFTGNNFRLTWTDLDTVAREYNWLVLGAASAGGTTYQKDGSIVADTEASGADVREAVEAGALVADTEASGADAREAVEAGALATGAVLAGADVREAVEAGATWAGALLSGTSALGGGTTYNKAGSLAAGALAAGADAREAVEAGAVLASSLLGGADVREAVEAGAVTTGARVVGADVREAVETGTMTTGALAAGADVREAVEAGSVLAGSLAAGADVFQAVEAGSVTTRGLLSGAAVKETPGLFQKTGALTTGGLAAGADAFTATDAGLVVAGALLAGPKLTDKPRTASLLTAARQSGADVFQAVETGALVARALLLAADVFQAVETGTVSTASRAFGVAVKHVAGAAEPAATRRTLASGPSGRTRAEGLSGRTRAGGSSGRTQTDEPSA